MGRSREFLERITPEIASEVFSAVRREVAYSRGEPYAALLFFTYRCTSRCRTCKMWTLEWDISRELSADEWLKIADILADAGVHVFELFGGDAFLRKDALFPVIRQLKKRNAILHMPTNSNLLNEEAARNLVEGGMDYLYLSTDGVDDLHDSVRGINNAFSNVKRAVSALLKFRNSSGFPRIICNMTVSKFNVESMKKVAAFAEGAGFDEVDFEYVGEMTPEDVVLSEVDGLRPTPYFLKDEESVLVSPEQAMLLKQNIKEIRDKYSASSFRVGSENIDCLSVNDLVAGSVPQGRCYTERCEVTVDPAGNVVACPFFHSLKYGNLLQNSFSKVWLDRRHKRFHQCLVKNGLAMCRHCIPSVQRSQSFSERLERIYTARMRSAKRKLERRQ